MKNSGLTFFLVLISLNLAGQGDVIVSGRILDNSTHEPLPFASVSVTADADGRLVTGALTDESGRFIIRGIPEGEYVVNCSFIGYSPKKIPLLIGRLNKVFDLGKIELEPEATNLGEVVVSEKRDLVSVIADKKTFDIAGNISQSGGSVLDVMRNLPGITIDQEGRMELRGSDRITVLIDGKQSSLTGYGNQKGLSSIPASNIDRVEIINNPSSRYDAAGMAGIVNIVYKKESAEGFNGETGLGLGIGALSKRRDDLPTELGSYSFNHKIIPSLNLNYRKGKLNLFLQSEVLNQRRLPNNEFTTRIYDDGNITESQVPENRRQTQYIIKGGADLFLNDNNTLTFSAIYDYESHHDTAQVPYINMLNSARYRYWNWLEYEITGFMNYSVAVKHNFSEPGHVLNASVQYTRGWEDESYHLNDSSAIRISDDFTHIIATEHTANLIVDYMKPLKNGRLEAGTKLQARRIPVTYTVERGIQTIIYPGLGEWSDWGEDIIAGYLNWVYEGKKIDIEAGLRAENTAIFYDLAVENTYYPRNDEYDYFNIYPNTRVTFKINPNNSLSAYFNKRVDRPGEPELRVFPKYDDPELLKVGNPYLRPQFTNSFELAYKLRWKSGSMSLAGYYRSIKDLFTRIYSIDTTSVDYNIVNRIYSNVGSAENTGMEFILNQKIAGFWNLSASLNWYSNVINEYEGMLLFPYERLFNIVRTKDNSADIKINNQLTAGKTQFQLTALYYSPRNIPQGEQKSRSSVDVGIKQKILQDKGELTFSFADLFNDFGIKQEILGEGFNAVYENFFETQIITLGFKYKF